MLDFDRLHGTWVTDERYKGSYGRISYRETEEDYWVLWDKHAATGVGVKKKPTASRSSVRNLRILPVGPEPWFRPCLHCGHLPFEKVPMQIYSDTKVAS